MHLHLVLGNHLFAPSLWPESLRPEIVFMREDIQLCTYFPFHTHKIVLFLAAMRTYAEDLRQQGYEVVYDSLDAQSPLTYTQRLSEVLQTYRITSVSYFEIEDHFFADTLTAATTHLPVHILESPMFLTSRKTFSDYLNHSTKPFMKIFYEQQRRRLGLLLTETGKPLGGTWSFDADNRKPMPKTVVPPPLPRVRHSATVRQVIDTVAATFPNHVGNPQDFWLPVDRSGALAWLDQFISERLVQFGPYEDAMPSHTAFGFHSVLTPFLNIGLITPKDVLERLENITVPLPSLEGFVRQVIGWREFIRGIYHRYDTEQDQSNFFNHHRMLSPCFWEGNTSIPLLDRVIRQVALLRNAPSAPFSFSLCSSATLH